MARNEDSMHKGLVDRLAAQVGSRKLALNILRKRGHVKPHSEELTLEGRTRDRMGAAGRAQDRAAKRSGGRASDYKYNTRTNRATKKWVQNYKDKALELTEELNTCEAL